MPDIAGSLWSVDPAEQVDAARRLKDAGLQRLHWDSSDGRFAQPGGHSPERALQITADTGLAAEAHLMSADPAGQVDGWTEFCDLVIVHIESRTWPAALERIAARGSTPGLALSPGTPTHLVPPGVSVLCMTIAPGTAGSPFQADVLGKLPLLRKATPERRLGLDGGVRHGHVEAAERAGADWLVVGTDLFTGDGTARWQDVLRP